MTKRYPTKRDYPRTARLNELVHQIVAEELERMDDERLDLVTVIAVEVESDMNTGVVYWADSADADRDDEISEALEEVRYRLQKAIGRQARTKRVPHLSFQPDSTTRTAASIEGILRDLGPTGQDEEPGLSGQERQTGG
jgi:ribosome-binding factor A